MIWGPPEIDMSGENEHALQSEESAWKWSWSWRGRCTDSSSTRPICTTSVSPFSWENIWAYSWCLRWCYCWLTNSCRTLLWLHGLQPTRLFCSWNFPGKNIPVGTHFLLQGIFLTQGSNSCLLQSGRFFCLRYYIKRDIENQRVIISKESNMVGCMTQVLGPGALGRTRGIGWRGRWERGSGWGIHVNPWLIHVSVWRKPLKCCEVFGLQLITKNKLIN